jgi:glycosyltransferase involved in cell wall biosynthesis
MISVIIILHNQSKNLDPILLGLSRQSISDFSVIVIEDRPTESDHAEHLLAISSSNISDKILLHTLSNHPLVSRKNPDGSTFLAPYAREVGLDMAIASGSEYFIFIDGDCIPLSGMISGHLDSLKYNIPVLTCGRRREKKYRWQDMRECEPGIMNYGIFRGKGMLVNNPDLLIKSLLVWSCNIGLNLAAVRRIRELNRMFTGHSDLFCRHFWGAWGGEDGFLGIQAWTTRTYIKMLGDPMSGVDHIDHPRPAEIYNPDHSKFLSDISDKLRKYLVINPLDLAFFTNF